MKTENACPIYERPPSVPSQTAKIGLTNAGDIAFTEGGTAFTEGGSDSATPMPRAGYSAPTTGSPRRLTWRRKVLFAVLFLLLALTTLEAGVRIVNRVRLGRWDTNDPEASAANGRLYAGHAWLGQIPQPGTHVVSKGRRININAFGYRGREFGLTKPPGTLRIACIGGSTTFDIKVSDDEHAWPAQLETILHERCGVSQAEVVNAGTNGYSMPLTIIDLALRTLDVRPDWVVCSPGVNDLAFSDRPSQQAGRSHEAIILPGPTPPWWRTVLPYSELYNEINSRIRYARQVRWGNWEGVPIERRDEMNPAALAAFERNLTTLAGISQAHGIRLALVTVRTAYAPEQPLETQQKLAKGDLMDHPRLTLAGHYAGYREINRLIRAAAEKHGLLLLDQAAALPTGEEYFADSVHFNDQGAALFAEFAAERLAPAITERLAAAP